MLSCAAEWQTGPNLEGAPPSLASIDSPSPSSLRHLSVPPLVPQREADAAWHLQVNIAGGRPPTPRRKADWPRYAVMKPTAFPGSGKFEFGDGSLKRHNYALFVVLMQGPLCKHTPRVDRGRIHPSSSRGRQQKIASSARNLTLLIDRPLFSSKTFCSQR